MDKPLKGVRVVELSIFVAAPVCARLLADLGAEVIKVEHPNGDGWRYRALNYKGEVYTEAHNPVFDVYNSGKKHVALDLKSEDGMAAMHKLLETADVFLTNTRPAALERLGLGYEQLKEKYPSLIYAIILGYGAGAFASILGNCLQGLAGVVGSVLLFAALKASSAIRIFQNHK